MIHLIQNDIIEAAEVEVVKVISQVNEADTSADKESCVQMVMTEVMTAEETVSVQEFSEVVNTDDIVSIHLPGSKRKYTNELGKSNVSSPKKACRNVAHDHSYCVRSPRRLRKQVDILAEKNEALKKRLKISQHKTGRYKTKSCAKRDGQEVVCTLMLDEMAIRKIVEWEGKQMHGYVDLGTGTNDNSLPVATDVLVYMAVAVNSNLKVPCGYFLVNGVTGEQKANVTKECITKLYEVGIKVVPFTCDGPSHQSVLNTWRATVTW